MYLEYPSSQDPSLRLFAGFLVPEAPRRIMVQMHGWHGSVKKEHADNVDLKPNPDWFVIWPEMRGRGDSTGKPDCNGWELQDVIDAVAFARQRFADRIADPHLVTLKGGSGGGGNVFALLGKFPDFFCRGQADCGISDYALWFRDDAEGEFRDEMQGAGWIGGTPDDNPEAYASRGGLTTAGNLLTPIIIFHGENDVRVPAEQSRRFVAAAQRLGKWPLVTYHELPGVGTRSHWGNITPAQESFRKQTGDAFLRLDPRPAEAPGRGRFAVAGYLKTRRFEIILDSIDSVGIVEYDVDAARYQVRSRTARSAVLRVRGAGDDWQERTVAVEKIEHGEPDAAA